MSTEDSQTQHSMAILLQTLRERLAELVATLHPSLSADILQALKAKGKLLSQPPSPGEQASSSTVIGMWPLLTLLVAQAVSPQVDLFCASGVAVAIECFVCALDLLDDVEDGDLTPTVNALGIARALNVSTALLALAQKAIHSLSTRDVSPVLVLRLLDTMQEATLLATSGQHRDLLVEQQSLHEFTTGESLELVIEKCLEIARGKAGSIMRLACRLGAMGAGAEKELLEQFSLLGEQLGIAHQLHNDCHDLYDLLSSSGAQEDTTQEKSDMARGKKTLPIVLAHTLQESPTGTDIENYEDVHALQRGILAAWGIRLLYRERVRSCLELIQAGSTELHIAPPLRHLLDVD
jgi:geranylgeranyl pyrophosphate synthase